MSHEKKSWNVPIAGMWDISWTDSGKRFRKEHRKAKITTQGCKDKTPSTEGNVSDLASDTSSNGSLPATLGENDIAKESVISLFTALASIDISPTEESFDPETDTDSNFSLHGTTPKLGCSSPTWTTEDAQVLETFLDWSHGSSLSKRDAIYISSYERPSLSAFTPHQPDSGFLGHKDDEEMALELCHFVQKFTEGSFIARSTQVTTAVRTSGDADLGLSSEVTVTATAETKSSNRPRSSGTQYVAITIQSTLVYLFIDPNRHSERSSVDLEGLPQS
ncbi:hypothetical protein QQZ08_010642 [Neonectria magnoliae]|uniref:Uncharacterized protein n=1 Tax=Neonectria magnoliae TaxID=2732573 RepID=A0ABR1HFZ9_9HYPO